MNIKFAFGRFSCSRRILLAAWAFCFASLLPAQQFSLPFNEGSGTGISDSAGGLQGTLGQYLDPAVDYASIATSFSPSGAAGDHSLQIQGAGYLIANDSANSILDITNGPITIEAWVYLTTPSPGTTLWETVARYGGSYKLAMRGRRLAFTLFGKADMISTSVVPQNEWVHVAAVWNPGTGATFYTNGIARAVANTATPGRPILDNYLTIAAEGPSASTSPQRFPGFLDRVRIHHASLTAQELDSSAANPKPAYPLTLVAYDFNSETIPAQNNASAVLPAVQAWEFLPGWTSPKWTSDSPSGQAGDSALEFHNLITGGITPQTANVLDPSSTIALNGENGDYTLEAWIKLPATFPSITRRTIFRYEGNPGFVLSVSNLFLHTTAIGVGEQLSTATVPNDEAWHHVAVVHQDGVEFRFYVDGVLADTRPYTLGPGSGTLPRFTVGSGFNGANPFIGKMDRLRYSNQALAPQQFDFPAAPALSISGTPQDLVISWPVKYTGYVLEKTISLVSPQWQLVPHSEIGGLNTAQVQPTGTAFYRLRK